jgi:hypothetical protein
MGSVAEHSVVMSWGLCDFPFIWEQLSIVCVLQGFIVDWVSQFISSAVFFL